MSAAKNTSRATFSNNDMLGTENPKTIRITGRMRMSRPTPSGTAVTRRSLVKNLSLAAVVTAALPLRRSQAAELPHLDVKDPAAMAVGYLGKVSQGDLKQNPT